MLTKVAKEYESYKERMRNQELSSIEQQYLEELKAVQKEIEGGNQVNSGKKNLWWMVVFLILGLNGGSYFSW